MTWSDTDAVIDDRVLVALPDLHLDDGGSADIFRGTDDRNRALERFLQTLIEFKQWLNEQGRRLNVVQLGDFFDVWRAFPFHERDRGRTYDAITAAYGKVIAQLIVHLDARFCVGNHDPILAHYPPDWAFGANARLAYAQRACQGRLFCMHGHQTDDVTEAPISSGGQVWVALGSMLCAVNNPLGQAVEHLIDNSEDSYPGDDGGYPLGSPPVDSEFQATRWSDRGRRQWRLEQIFDGMRTTAPSIADPVQLVLVAHTHRPGIAWFVKGEQTVPVVDVGS